MEKRRKEADGRQWKACDGFDLADDYKVVVDMHSEMQQLSGWGVQRAFCSCLRWVVVIIMIQIVITSLLGGTQFWMHPAFHLGKDGHATRSSKLLFDSIVSEKASVGPVVDNSVNTPDCMASSVDELLKCRSFNNSVAITVASPEYLELALNWDCHWKRRLKQTNTIVVTSDPKVHAMLWKMQIPAVIFRDGAKLSRLLANSSWESELRSILLHDDVSSKGSGNRKATSFDVLPREDGIGPSKNDGSPIDVHGAADEAKEEDERRGRQKEMHYTLCRALFVEEVLRRGYDVFVSDVDAVVLQNPYLHIDPQLNFQGISKPPATPRLEKLLHDGFLFIKASPLATQVWRTAILEYVREESVQFASRTGPNEGREGHTTFKSGANVSEASKVAEVTQIQTVQMTDDARRRLKNQQSTTTPPLGAYGERLARRRQAIAKVKATCNYKFPKELMRNKTEDGDGLYVEIDGLRWGHMRSDLRADGKEFFVRQLTQARGEWPVVIHVNHVKEGAAKKERMMRASLWAVSGDGHTCAAFPGEVPPPPPASRQLSDIQFKLIVFTFNRPKALSALLDSLAAADYTALPPDDSTNHHPIRDKDRTDTDPERRSQTLRRSSELSTEDTTAREERGVRSLHANVSLEIFMDYPTGEMVKDEDGESMKGWRECLSLAESFQWPYGAKTVIVRRFHVGLVGQWFSAWNPSPSSNEIAMIIEDDHLVSTQFFAWLQAAVRQYYIRSYDPRLYGIALEYQHQVLDCSKFFKPLSDFVPSSTRFYRTQLVSTWCPAFFPAHWSAFIAWMDIVVRDPKFVPFFSNMMTNSFETMSSWVDRFIGEKGWYSLYANFPNKTALIVNQRCKGEHFNRDQGPLFRLHRGALYTNMTAFPPIDQLPLYDFSMNLVQDDPSVLEGRANYTDVYNVELA